MKRLYLAIMVMAIDFAHVTSEPSELERLKKTLDMVDLTLAFDILGLRRDLDTERRLRLELQTTVHQLQEQMFANNHTNSINEIDNLRADFKTQQSIIENVLQEVHVVQNQNHILRNDNTRLQNENNDLRHMFIALNEAFKEEKHLRKQMERRVNGLRLMQENLQFESVQETLQLNGLKLSEFEKHLNLRVSFSAQVSPSINDIDPYETIVFGKVIHNEGNAYNPINGIFVAPVDGTYVFFSNLLTLSKEFEAVLMINETIELLLYTGQPNKFANGSNMIVIHMDKGDRARMIKHNVWGKRPFYIHNYFSTFSGFLLNAG
ncbi:hypothetical protein ACJMK2_044536 [Sinanodonta woodiana]|uniref:C1q domain-containing protein n=1 Tax=Sinanodonta woodiana TaxID=1069815 RepID=A0ABD3W400_SINWO